MQHVAIMKRSWGFIEKILSGEKKIESRWYKLKRSPWDKIKKGEIVYFKNSGEQVALKTRVREVMQFNNLDSKKVKNILDKFGKDIGIDQTRQLDFTKYLKVKKYCILIFLKNVQKVEPFEIDKKGFGAMTAWISMENINMIKR